MRKVRSDLALRHSAHRSARLVWRCELGVGFRLNPLYDFSICPLQSSH